MSLHKYNSEGKLVEPWEDGYFSVTTILGVKHNKWLWEWKMRLGKEESEKVANEAADKGTRVHRRLEKILTGQEFKTTPKELKPYIDAFNSWFVEYQPEIIHAELFVSSDRYGYAGTVDLVCFIDGEVWIVDFKTSKAIYDEYGLQVRAYGYAYEEYFGMKNKVRTGILQLGIPTKKGWKFREKKEPMNVFLAHKKIFDWELKHHPIKKPKVKV